MLLSYRRHFIFVHIFKTAGTSVNEILVPYARFVDRLAYGFWPTRKAINATNRIFRLGRVPLTGFHKHATALEIKNRIPEIVWNTSCKFAFVRNPWDWHISLYFYIRENRGHRHHKLLQQMDFGQFLEWHLKQKPRRQIDFIADEHGNIILDYIGKFENLHEEMWRITDRLGIEYREVPRKNISRGRSHADYRKYYDATLRCAIEEYFKEDIARFGYRFE